MSFLTPQDRTLLIESLRPPAGYQLDTAIGTTYSLDLIAMMVAPVGFTFFDVDPSDPAFLRLDPLELLEAIRRHADQIVLFCEAGRIAVPKHHRPLLTYLEPRIVQARAPTTGRSFHPKVWIIRYTHPNGNVCYRLLCLSRNLTFDRSWDTVLTLDGPLRNDRAKGLGANAGLREFVAALPGMAITKVSAGIRDQVALIEAEISRVEWDFTDTPFEFLRFWPLGHNDRKTWPFTGRMQRLVVVSPFASGGVLTKLARGTEGSVLISRTETLDTVSDEVLDAFDEHYQLSNQAATAESEDDDTLPASDTPMQGLHAKLYIADDGRDGRLWTGSANATSSAFSGNVEFLVELTGKKSAIGAAAFLEKVKGSASFADLLEPYHRPESVPADVVLEALKRELDKLRLPIAAAEWTVSIESGESAQEYLSAASTKYKLPEWGAHVAVSCRPLSMDASFAQLLVPTSVAYAAFKAQALESLTAFLVIDIQADHKGKKATVQFVVNAALLGAPANRRDRILQHMLHDRRALLRFLLLLLADVSDDPLAAIPGPSQRWGASTTVGTPSEALLEPLLRTLARSPGRLRAIESLLRELGSTEDGAKLIPDGLPGLFAAVWSASEESAP